MFIPFGFMKTPVPASDADADAFIAAAGITDPTQEAAIQTLVTDLKSANVWTKCNAIYPFVGGTATAHKFNLKDPRDLDVAYRLTFNGTVNHTSNGMQPNGTTNDFGDSHWDVTVDASVNEHHVFKYATIPSTTGCGYDGQGSPYLIVGTCSALESYSGAAAISSGGSRTGGYAMGILRTTSTQVYFYRYLNSSPGPGWNVWNSQTVAVGTILSANYTLGKINAVGYPNNDVMSFYTLGGTMTQTEYSNLYDAVQTFNTTLSRAV